MNHALTRLVEARTVETVWAILTREMSNFGFDRLLYGFTRFRTRTGIGNRDDMLVLTNHDDGYIRPFFDKAMFNRAPMTVWALENEGAMSWSYINRIEAELDEEQKQILEFNRAHGVIAGYTISFADSSARQKGAIALTARKGLNQCDVENLWASDGETVNLLAQVAHLKIAALPFPSHMKRLSPRQREVLEWVGDGKTMQDIAEIMGLTPPTVEKHLRKAREALDVDTTTQAVMKASLQRQIFVTDI
ncbi:LuxR family transcriptional regulator [Alphaproteobacteria bacterium GH1-50]|uniref:LuxR family transcriptional regulator n=1 Tax=Kangsaoukella pontilimi TaxID=2691042 RepID=A0A7C9MUU4_9RHOB|nr:LuxR family transcriptional regulator [Kangsaoukella pontilimi]MXQ07160.1 LuxR family transcriptional regulator [Kangsaoukella pontilimi]